MTADEIIDRLTETGTRQVVWEGRLIIINPNHVPFELKRLADGLWSNTPLRLGEIPTAIWTKEMETAPLTEIQKKFGAGISVSMARKLEDAGYGQS